MMLPSRLGCPMSQKTPNMGNPGLDPLCGIQSSVLFHFFELGERVLDFVAVVP